MRLATWLLLVTVCGPSLFAQPQRATVVQWRADIDYLASELPKRHPNPFTVTSRETLLGLLNALKGDVPLLADVDIVQRLQMAVASLGDGHTFVNTNVYSLTFFPLVVYPFSDGLFVIRTTADARLACGAKLIAVDGVPVEEAFGGFRI